mmetsp:Transcript_11271/g.32501  ORF Transcript_11271/g.32501 Transcript_11271/m.32501 type:complete len:282 (+) Transcript_11271:181-1026(+)|eukprot:CAMPEP_0172365438 /NCGR_PEP_ID=MMETSP1060-20121228/9435_1 /TAXON_ID=37318 /ORGANISM="Pseudo-nitzschia pungens, Strain cf. cingulata" /LENGTH=281 /DNA_ID=CAMNT_0013088723 /DNA_START=130 /DNA_END=975 /DNA_ORIENTATION=-
MSASTSKMLIGSALLVAAVAAKSFLSSDPPESHELAEIDEDYNEGDFITGDDVCKVFDRLFMEMQAVLAQLSHTVQQIQMSGQVIPEQQLRQLLITEYQRALAAKQQQALDEADMDYDCFEEATWEFLEKEDEYPKVKKSVERFQKLWENISGESVVGRRKGSSKEPAKAAEPIEILSPQKTIEAAEIYFDSLTGAMRELVKNFKDAGKNLSDPAVAQQLQMEFAGVANDKGEEALKEIGITQMQFQKSIEANSTHPQVGRALAMLQMKQQQELASMGVGA